MTTTTTTGVPQSKWCDRIYHYYARHNAYTQEKLKQAIQITHPPARQRPPSACAAPGGPPSPSPRACSGSAPCPPARAGSAPSRAWGLGLLCGSSEGFVGVGAYRYLRPIFPRYNHITHTHTHIYIHRNKSQTHTRQTDRQTDRQTNATHLTTPHHTTTYQRPAPRSGCGRRGRGACGPRRRPPGGSASRRGGRTGAGGRSPGVGRGGWVCLLWFGRQGRDGVRTRTRQTNKVRST